MDSEELEYTKGSKKEKIEKTETSYTKMELEGSTVQYIKWPSYQITSN